MSESFFATTIERGEIQNLEIVAGDKREIEGEASVSKYELGWKRNINKKK